MIIRQVITGEIQENCYIVMDKETKKGFLVDPGDEGGKITAAIEELGVELQYIILTHGHFDHVGALEYIADKYKIPFYMNEEDEKFKDIVPSLFPNVRKADGYLKDGDVLKLNSHEIKVIGTPGHTEGGLSFLIQNCLFTGDTLFKRSCGRVDFPGGNGNKIINSLNKLFSLDDDIVVYPGHGPSSTIGYEKENNPCLD